jgi:hypothetical protein
MSVQNKIYTRDVNFRNSVSSFSVKVLANASAAYDLILPPTAPTAVGQFLETSTSGNDGATAQWSNVVRAALGSTSAPSLTFIGATGTGFSAANNNNMSLSTGGAEVVKINGTSTNDASVAVKSSLEATDATGNTGSLRTLGGVSVAKSVHVGGSLSVAGNLTVIGTTTSVDSTNVNIQDNNIFLGSNNTTMTVVSGGISVNVGGVSNGVESTTEFKTSPSPNTVTAPVTGIAIGGGDFIQISGSSSNDGLYEVLTFASGTNLITINTSPTYKFCNNAFIAEALNVPTPAKVTHVNVSQIFTSAGSWKVSEGKDLTTTNASLKVVATVGAGKVTNESISGDLTLSKGITNMLAAGIVTLPVANAAEVGNTYIVRHAFTSGVVTITTGSGSIFIGDGTVTTVVLNQRYQYVRLTCAEVNHWIMG